MDFVNAQQVGRGFEILDQCVQIDIRVYQTLYSRLVGIIVRLERLIGHARHHLLLDKRHCAAKQILF